MSRWIILAIYSVPTSGLASVMSPILMMYILPVPWVEAHRFAKSAGFSLLKHDAHNSSGKASLLKGMDRWMDGWMDFPGPGFQKSFPIGFPSWTVSDLPGLEKHFSKSDENVKIFHYYDTFGSPRVDAGLGYSALVADVDANRCVLGHSDGLGIK